MFKWHARSAIGRSRPAGNDFTRVADGIAASLRQFSISVSRNAEDGSSEGILILRRDKTYINIFTGGFKITREAPMTRSQRGRDASNEIRTLPRKPPAGGIDARAFAAKPPVMKISRVEMGSSSEPRPSFVRRGDYKGGVGSDSRGGARGGMRGRGDRGGRGGRGGPGRGRGAKQSKEARKKQEEEETREDPFNAEELLYLEGSEQGFETPWEPKTSPKDLANYGPAVMSSSRGVTETIVHRLNAATGKFTGYDALQLQRLDRANGTMFTDHEEKALYQAARDSGHKAKTDALDVDFNQTPFQTLRGKDRAIIKKQWVAGEHIAPEFAPKSDVLAHVESYLRRNETYLPADLQKLQAKIASLLPPELLSKSKPRKVEKRL